MLVKHNFRRMIFLALGIVLAGVLMGIAANTLSPNGIPYDCKRIPTPTPPPTATPSGTITSSTAPVAASTPIPATDIVSRIISPGSEGSWDFVDLNTAKEAWESQKFLFIDARSLDEYVNGHIEGATNLFADEFETLYPLGLINTPTDTPVILYCAGTGCQLSIELANYLLPKDWTRIRIFYDGWNNWKDAGLPTVTGPKPYPIPVDATATVILPEKVNPVPFVTIGLALLALIIAGITRARSEAAHNSLFVLFRLLLGALFLVACYDKIADPAQFARNIDDYKILPCPLVPLAAIILPWIEAILGLLLIFGLFTEAAALLATFLLFSFTAGLIASIFRGLSMECGCFDLLGIVEKIAGHKVKNHGWIETLTTVGWPTVVRDLYFLLPAVYLLWRPNRFLALDRLWEATRNPESIKADPQGSQKP